MTLPLQGEFIRLILSRASGLGGLMENTFIFRVDANLSNCQQAADLLKEDFSHNFNNWMIAGDPLQNVFVECLTNRNIPSGTAIKSQPTQGAMGFPPQVCAKIRLRTSALGSRHHGKLYPVTPHASWMSNNVVGAGGYSAFNQWNLLMMGRYIGPNASQGFTLHFRYNRASGQNHFAEVEYMELHPYFSTMRSRRPGIGA